MVVEDVWPQLQALQGQRAAFQLCNLPGSAHEDELHIVKDVPDASLVEVLAQDAGGIVDERNEMAAQHRPRCIRRADSRYAHFRDQAVRADIRERHLLYVAGRLDVEATEPKSRPPAMLKLGGFRPAAAAAHVGQKYT